MDHNLQRLHCIARQIQCPTCNGQTLDASEVLTAVAFKEDIIAKIEEGKTDKEIMDTLVQAHGAEILHNAPLSKTTYLLWGVPIMVMVGIVIFLVLRYFDQQVTK